MDIYSYDVKKKRRVKAGVVDGDMFIRKVIRKKHYLWTIRGYAISLDVYSEIRKSGVVSIVFQERKKKLGIHINDFYKKGVRINLGHGPQIAIEEKYLDEIN